MGLFRKKDSASAIGLLAVGDSKLPKVRSVDAGEFLKVAEHLVSDLRPNGLADLYSDDPLRRDLCIAYAFTPGNEQQHAAFALALRTSGDGGWISPAPHSSAFIDDAAFRATINSRLVRTVAAGREIRQEAQTVIEIPTFSPERIKRAMATGLGLSAEYRFSPFESKSDRTVVNNLVDLYVADGWCRDETSVLVAIAYGALLAANAESHGDWLLMASAVLYAMNREEELGNPGTAHVLVEPKERGLEFFTQFAFVAGGRLLPCVQRLPAVQTIPLF
jgi:hypothetical protein